MRGTRHREAPGRLAGVRGGRRREPSARSTLPGFVVAVAVVALLAVAVVAARADAGTNPAPDPAATVCERGFAWGEQCWTKGEGQAFSRWLREHGASPAAFKRRRPELAHTFGKGWPSPPLKACASASCVPAVVRAWFPDRIEEHALAIVRCETGGTFDPRAVGDGGYSRGIWQINYVHWRKYGGWVDQDRLFEPWYATAVAHRMSRGGRDFSAWTCERYV